jgi:hypothetical protein
VRALLLCVSLLGCASANPGGVSDFQWIAGCWRSPSQSVTWAVNDAEWVGAIEGEPGCGPQRPNALAPCRFLVREDSDHRWAFWDARTDGITTYALETLSADRARFRAQGHPMRPQPEIWLDVVVEEESLRISTSGRLAGRISDGQRC